MLTVVVLAGIVLITYVIFKSQEGTEKIIDWVARSVLRGTSRRNLAAANTAMAISAPVPPPELIARIVQVVNAHESAPPIVGGLYLKDRDATSVYFGFGNKIKGDEFAAAVRLTESGTGSTGRFDVVDWLEYGPFVGAAQEMPKLRARVTQAVESLGGTVELVERDRELPPPAERARKMGTGQKIGMTISMVLASGLVLYGAVSCVGDAIEDARFRVGACLDVDPDRTDGPIAEPKVLECDDPGARSRIIAVLEWSDGNGVRSCPAESVAGIRLDDKLYCVVRSSHS